MAPVTKGADKHKEGGQLYSIQYFRAAAALMVVIAHAAAHPLNDPPVWTWYFGRLGVTLFFVISGFIMTVISPEGPFHPGRFLWRRIVRIVPLYWAITFFSAAAAIVAPTVFRNTVFDIGHFIGSLFFVPMYRPASPGAVEPFVKLGWTLNYEMFFYLVFAGLFFLRSTARSIVLTALFVLLVFLGRQYEFTNAIAKFYAGYDLLGFVFGVWTGWGYRRGFLSRVGAPSAAIAGLVALGACVFLAATTQTRYPSIQLQLALCLISCVLIGAGIVWEQVGRLRLWSPLATLGDASYSIYLTHMFAIGVVAVSWWRLVGRAPELVEWIALAGIGVLTGGLITGLATYFLVEKPLVAFAKFGPTRPKPAHVGGSPIKRRPT